MKDKKVVSYIKNGNYIKNEFNIFTRNKIINDIFILPKEQPDNYEYYEIQKDIEYLNLKNITFKKDAKFLLTENNNIELENCDFKGGRLGLTNGSITITNSTFNPCNYINRIILKNVNNFNLNLNNSNSFLSIIGESKNTRLSGNYRVETITLTGSTIEINDMKDIKTLRLNNHETTLNNCNFGINLSNETQYINTKKTNIINSNLYYQGDFEKLTISPYLEEKNNILENNNNHLQTNTLNLKNSKIESNDKIMINIPNLIMDNESKIQSNECIELNNYILKSINNNKVEINKEEYRKILIKLLKTLRIKIDNNIEEKTKKKLLKRI